MLTLGSTLSIPDYVSFSVVGEDAFLLNTKTNKYFGLEKVGTRLWELLKTGNSLKTSYAVILKEYIVDPNQLEQDLLELVSNMLKNGLVEIVKT